ncbi:uncharacterized protein BDZ99DRAFT_383996 [Mytilinidion resinicola]|uniref:Uncharacterized protein n=1 Tax=Mytilinidion resinicola TaxID=574789 RepID=A0A6A6YWH9_9PEZI|nr:uncharacterized protein BDZ99DRAFT_383996 [Mytilinidion resinicola]KAF2812354.1 hypothetical protein BDZ99DRAFT_383996 [Mytilinidion resinicola]
MATSLVYGMLPTLVQSRMPRFSSLRRSVNDFRGRPDHTRSSSENAWSSGSDTPPPRYSSRQESRVSDRIPAFTADASDSDLDTSTTYERPVSSSSTPPAFTLAERESGVNWKYANQAGLHLITQAHQESSSLTKEGDDDGLPPFSRQLYIHGITYVLRGLPADMTPEEILSIQAAIPPHVLDHLDLDPTTQDLISTLSRRPQTLHEPLEEDPSVIHRITAALILELFIIAQFLLPYVKLFIGHAYQYERENRVFERLFSVVVNTIDEVGRKSIRFTNSVCSMNDGKVGQALNDMTVWWVQGVTGGIHQGISEGVVILGADGKIPRTRRKVNGRR